MMNPSTKSLNGSRGLLASVLDHEALMLVANGSIIGYLFFIFTLFMGGCFYSIGQEAWGLLMIVGLPAIWSVLPSFIFILKQFDLKKSAAIALYFAAFTPWVILDTAQRPAPLVAMTIVFSLWASIPLLALALKDLKNRRLGGPSVLLLAIFFPLYFIFLYPMPNEPSLVTQPFPVSIAWALWLLSIAVAEYLLKIMAHYC